MVRFSEWLNQFAYVGKGITEGTVENALLQFFYEGLTPLIQSAGYKWIDSERHIAKKFLRFCFLVYETSSMDVKYSLEIPEARHRDFPEDRDTFDLLLDTWTFVEFMEEWSFCDSFVGTRLEYLLRDFCYVWIDVQSGKPGALTQIVLDAMSENHVSDDDTTNILPDGNWSRRMYDLY